MNVGTLHEFEKELRGKLHDVLEKEREKFDFFNEYLYVLEIQLFRKVLKNYDYLWLMEKKKKKKTKRLKKLLSLYIETSNLYTKVSDINNQVTKIKEMNIE